MDTDHSEDPEPVESVRYEEVKMGIPVDIENASNVFENKSNDADKL